MNKLFESVLEACDGVKEAGTKLSEALKALHSEFDIQPHGDYTNVGSMGLSEAMRYVGDLERIHALTTEEAVDE